MLADPRVEHPACAAFICAVSVPAAPPRAPRSRCCAMKAPAATRAHRALVGDKPLAVSAGWYQGTAIVPSLLASRSRRSGVAFARRAGDGRGIANFANPPWRRGLERPRTDDRTGGLRAGQLDTLARGTVRGHRRPQRRRHPRLGRPIARHRRAGRALRGVLDRSARSPAIGSEGPPSARKTLVMPSRP